MASTATASVHFLVRNILNGLLYFRFSRIWLLGERLSPMLVT